MARFESRRKRILTEGAQATAVVTAVRQPKVLGVPVGQRDSLEFKLTLTVRPQDEPEFEAKVSAYFHQWSQPVVGSQLAVRYDPSNKMHVEIDDKGGSSPANSRQ